MCAPVYTKLDTHRSSYVVLDDEFDKVACYEDVKIQYSTSIKTRGLNLAVDGGEGNPVGRSTQA